MPADVNAVQLKGKRYGSIDFLTSSGNQLNAQIVHDATEKRISIWCGGYELMRLDATNSVVQTLNRHIARQFLIYDPDSTNYVDVGARLLDVKTRVGSLETTANTLANYINGTTYTQTTASPVLSSTTYSSSNLTTETILGLTLTQTGISDVAFGAYINGVAYTRVIPLAAVTFDSTFTTPDPVTVEGVRFGLYQQGVTFTQVSPTTPLSATTYNASFLSQ